MQDDRTLLRQFAEQADEAAFTELVRRHVNLVFTAAQRRLNGDTALAQDVTQQVFIDLSRNARRWANVAVLGGWLHQHTGFVAGKALRAEIRRKQREGEALAMNNSTGETLLTKLGGVLDEALDELSPHERDVLVLRYFERHDLRTIGARLGLSDDAAQKRVSRALDQLRQRMALRGHALPAATVAAALAAAGAATAPAAMAAGCSAAALAASSFGASSTGFLIFMNAKNAILLVAALIIAGGATVLTVRNFSPHTAAPPSNGRPTASALVDQSSAPRTNTTTVALLRPRLPAPKIDPVQIPPPPAAPAAPATTTNLQSRIANGSFPKLTPEQVEAYLAANGRTAATLIAAFHASGNAALLMEAMQNFSSDPHVAFAAALSSNLKPEEQRAWLDALKKSAPDNALPNCLSALAYFNAGQSDQAVEELLASAGKRQFQNYSLGSAGELERAYLSAGYSEAEAKVFASLGQTLPEVSSLKSLALDISRLADGYRQVGDGGSAQAALLLSAVLGESYGATSDFMMTRLVGFAMETTALKALDPNIAYGNNGQTVQNRLDEIVRQKALIRELTQQTTPLFNVMSDQDWVAYINHLRSSGEIAALQWLAARARTP